MRCRWLLLLLLAAWTGRSASLSSAAGEFLAGANTETPAVAGASGWWFAVDEIELLCQPPVEGTSQEQAVAAMRNRNRQLEEQGIHLLLLPVPLRAEICASGWHAAGNAPPVWEYSGHATALCRKAAPVIDLLPAMREAPESEIWYCRSDSHWSPELIRLAAREVAAVIRLQPWYRDEARSAYPARDAEIVFTGDLATAAGAGDASEKWVVRHVGGTPVEENAPILLIGDSHSLIFSTGNDMLSTGAGLAEQLAYELGIPVERLGSRGSAGSAIWQQVYRKQLRNPEWWKQKKVVIWCFSVCALLNGDSAWYDIPIQEQAKQQLELK